MKKPHINLDEKTDLLMKVIKTMHDAGGNNEDVSTSALQKRRSEQERFAKLIAPSIGVETQHATLNNIPCQWTKLKTPHKSDHVILYCHGGGFTCGGLEYAAILAGKLSLHTGFDVFSYAYRLAPEYPYPAAIDDTMAVWDALMMQGYGAKDIYVAGDSAGGNLALSLVLKLKQTGRILPGALILFSPWTDMTSSGSSYKKFAEVDPIVSMSYIEAVKHAYAGPDADFSKACFSPLFGDLTDFPPTLIQVGENEILQSDSQSLAKNLRAQGGIASLEIYKGGWHVFQQMPIPKASKALDDVRDFLYRL